jgi:nucleoid DNA-binding protein
MSKIGNKELARVLMEKHGLDKEAAERFVEQMFDVLGEGLQTDKMVKVKGLGTFKVTSVASRKSVDVNTGEPIIIEGRDKISFTPDNSLRDQVNRPFAQFDTVVLNDGVDFAEIDERFAESMAESDGQGDEASSQEFVEDDMSGDKEAPMPETTVAPADNMPATTEESAVGGAAKTAASPAVGVMLAEESVEVSDDEEKEAEESQPLTLSAVQLDALNGTEYSDMTKAQPLQPMVGLPTAEAESVTDEAVTETTPEQAEPEEVHATETMSAPMPEPVDEVEEKAEEPETTARYVEPLLHTATPEPAKQAVETAEASYLDEMRSENIMLGEKVDRQHRTLKWLIGLSAVLLIGLVAGAVYLFGELEKRENRIRHLEAQAVLMAQTPAGKAALKALVDSDAVKKAHADSVAAARQLEAIEAASQAERQALEKAEAKARQMQDEAPAHATKPSAAKAVPQPKATVAASRPVATPATAKKSAEKPVAAQSVQSKAAVQPTDYDKDVRVRTGAYRITGVERTVTVKAGQTLSSISKANLGPGMECYIEAVNGGRREFKAGEKINIPALKLKKSR